MFRIRPFALQDLPAVARLRRRVFAHSRWASQAELESYLHEVFFESPWVDPEMPSVVLEVNGAVAGFAGVIPRPFVFEGQRVRGAVMTQLMAAPEVRGGAGTRLLDRVFHGPQDFLLTDVPNHACRAIWEKLGGQVATVFGCRWSRPLRPARHSAGKMGMKPAARAARLAARPVLAAIDVAAAVIGGPGWKRPRPPGRLERLDARTMVEALPALIGRRSLRPHYDASTLAWLLDHLAARYPEGLDQWSVVNPEGWLDGWFITTQNPGGVAHLLHLVAREKAYRAVLEHAIRRTHDNGAVALEGRYDARYAQPLGALGAEFRHDGPPILVHARRTGLVEAVLEGRAVLTGLEGEWWLGF